MLKTMEKECEEKVKFPDKDPSIKDVHYKRHLYPLWAEEIAAVARDQRQENAVLKDSIDDYLLKKQHSSKFSWDWMTNQPSPRSPRKWGVLHHLGIFG